MLLLLDLDGVLVSDGEGDTCVGKEILCIHPGLKNYLRTLDFPVAVLTHRSRKEASQIVKTLELDGVELLEVFTANDIAFRRLTPGRFLSLLRFGARKSRIIPYIQARWKVNPEDIAFVDDRKENVIDMVRVGVGLGVHVPAARFLGDQRTVSTFDMEDLMAQIQDWSDSKGQKGSGARMISLKPIQIPQQQGMFSGVVMQESGLQIFKRIRGLRRLFKRFIRWGRVSC